MRKLPSTVLLGVAVPALSALPVLTPSTPTPEPVAPTVRAAAVAPGVDSGALASPAGRASLTLSRAARADIAEPVRRGALPQRPAVLTAPKRTAGFELLGVTWDRAGEDRDLTVLVRTHGGDGWGEWTSLDAAPTPAGPEGATARGGTEPLWAGPSDGYQVRVDVRTGRLPGGIRVDLVDPGDSAADDSVGDRAPLASAAAATTAPRIYTRGEWGADESLRSGSPSYNTTIKAGFVHHTAGTNGYSSADVPKIIRGIYAYHTKSNGWSDLGYNFLVDRFGRLWEGRAGGIDKAVMGAHTGGFNVDTFGVSAIGDYEKVAAPAPMVDSIARLLAWKLATYYRDPLGKTVLTSQGGGTSRYAAGARVTFNVVSAHRDAGYTECPGKYLYAKLATIRSLTSGYVGTGLVAPRSSAGSTPYAGAPVTVTAGALRAQSWRLRIREGCRGTIVRTLRGSAARGLPVNAVWNLKRSDGSWVRPGAYTVTLDSWDSSSTALPFVTALTVTGSAAGAAPGAVALPGDASYVPLTPARLYDSRGTGRQPLGTGGRLDLKVLGAGGVPATGVAAVALNVTGTCPSSDTYLTVWPAGARKPTASTLNLPALGTRAAFTVAAVGGAGKVSIGNSTGWTDVIVDVVGYYAKSTTVGHLYHPAAARRVFDSRSSGGTLATGASRTVALPTLAGVTGAQMSAAVLNVTAIGPGNRNGFLTAYPAGTTRPNTSTVNFGPGGPVANRAVVKLSKGRLTVTNLGVPANVVLDVVGFYAAPAVTGGHPFRALTPVRVLDTRTGLGAPARRLGTASSLTLAVTGTGRPVPTGASAAVLTLTSVAATRNTYLTAWPAGAPKPVVSDLSVDAGRTTANLVVVPLSSTGRLQIGNYVGDTQVVGDVIGYYR